ncbi:MAG: 4Fe-4S binding protein [Candidatus Cloacimonadota bacterium]|nr:4Fe-4S binding protein [Candidatus Cloacimonadota bacterium]
MTQIVDVVVIAVKNTFMKKKLVLLFTFIIVIFCFFNLFSAEKPDLEIFEGKLKNMGGEWFIISDGDFFQLNLASGEFLKENNIILTSKEQFKAEGVIIEEVINVYRIHANDSIVELRDDTGNPLWQEKKQLGHYVVNSKKCIGCQLCVSACPTDAISMVHGRAIIDADKCIDCAICEIGNGDYKGCPTGAIKKQE